MSDFSEAKFTAQKKRMRHGRVPHVSGDPRRRPCGRTKQTLRSSQAKTERVQILRQEYWQQVADIDLEDLVFIDKWEFYSAWQERMPVLYLAKLARRLSGGRQIIF